MHPAFVYIVVQALDEETRRANSYLPDPDPSVEPDPRPVRRARRVAVARPRPRSPASPPPFVAARARLGRRLAPEG